MTFPIGYTRYQDITIDKNKVSGTNIRFVFKIDLSDMVKVGDDIFDTCRTDGGDIRITLVDGTTQLARKVSNIDTTGKTGEVWVCIPQLDYTIDLVVRVWYNGTDTEPAVDSTYGAESVFDGTWIMYHTMDDATTSTITDATSNNNDGVKLSANNPIEADGTVGKAQLFSSDEINIPSSTSLNNLTQCTITVWAETSDVGITNQGLVTLWASATDRMQFKFAEDEVRVFNDIADKGAGSNGGTIVNDTPVMLTLRITGEVWSVFVDDSLTPVISTDPDNSLFDLADGFTIRLGNAYASAQNLAGKISLVSIKTGAKLDSWRVTEYNNQSSPSTFYSVSDEQTGTPKESTPGVYPISGTFLVSSEITLTSDADDVYYTTNGTTPTSGSTLYTTPIEMFDGTLKAIGITSGLDDSELAIETYVIGDQIALTIVNPGAEAGDLTGWTTEAGLPCTREDSPLSPHSGDYFFFGGSELTDGIFSQELDLITGGVSGVEIDAGNLSLELKWWQAANAVNDDDGNALIRFKNASHSLISSIESPSTAYVTQVWLDRALTGLIPVNTRYIDIVMESEGTSGNISCFFDDVSIRVFEAPDSAFTINFSDYIDDSVPSDWIEQWDTVADSFKKQSGATPWGDSYLAFTHVSDKRSFLAWDSPPRYADVDIMAATKFESAVDSTSGIITRGYSIADKETGYRLSAASGGVLYLQRYSNGDSFLIDSISKSLVVDTWYNIRFQIIGTALKGKIWDASIEEPAAWDIDETDTNISGAGQFGVFSYGCDCEWDFFSIGMDGEVPAFPSLKVNTPVMDPVSGIYASSQTITLTSTNADDIYYTTDGSTPDATDTLYTTPIAMFDGTLKAIGIASGLDDSDVATEIYIISSGYVTELYINSELITSETSAAGDITADAGGSFLGQVQGSVGGTFDPAAPLEGQLSKIKIFRSGIDLLKVKSLFNELKVAPSGQIVHYRMDYLTNEDTVLIDSEGNYDGAVGGTPNIEPGIIANCIEFNPDEGTGDSINLDGFSAELDVSTVMLGVSFWMNSIHNPSTIADRIFSMNDSSDTDLLAIGISSDGYLFLQTPDLGSVEIDLGDITDGEWKHIVVIFYANSIHFYLNKQVYNVSKIDGFGSIMSTVAKVSIAQQYNSGAVKTNWYNGKLDDFRLFVDTELDAGKAAYLYEVGRPLPGGTPNRLNSLLRVKMNSTRDTYDSYNDFDFNLHRGGYGYSYGQFYGG